MKKAFTLIELLVVVLIIGILSAISLAQYRKAVNRTRAAEARVAIKALNDAMDEYYLANGKEITTGAYNGPNFEYLPMSDIDLNLDLGTLSSNGKERILTNWKISVGTCQGHGCFKIESLFTDAYIAVPASRSRRQAYNYCEGTGCADFCTKVEVGTSTSYHF